MVHELAQDYGICNAGILDEKIHNENT